MRSRLLRPAWQRCWPEFLFAILIWWLQILESHSSLNQIKNQATDSEKWLSIQSKIEINEKHLKNNRTPVREILQSFSNIEQLLGSVIDSTTSNKIEAAIGSEQITTNQSKTNQTIGLEITEKEKHQINLEREDHQRSINRSPEKMSSAATRRQARFEAGKCPSISLHLFYSPSLWCIRPVLLWPSFVSLLSFPCFVKRSKPANAISLESTDE